MPKDPEKISPPFSKADLDEMRRILEEARIDPKKFFKIPKKKDPTEYGGTHDPKMPKPRIRENYNGQKGDGTFKEDREAWQPKCDESFSIEISEAWKPPPAGLAGRFDLWAEFATVRAILICRKNDRCRRALPLGCDHAVELLLANGEVVGRASFAFQCSEI